jgi:hypothetical protein
VKSSDTDFFDEMLRLTNYHLKGCDLYRRLAAMPEPSDLGVERKLDSLPFIPVESFKFFKLVTVGDDVAPGRMLTSSGTSGTPSRIYANQRDLLFQIRALRSLFTSRVGMDRFDYGLFPGNPLGSCSLTASEAGIQGFGQFCKKKLRYAELQKLLELVSQGQTPSILLFGFTFELYNFFKELGNIDLAGCHVVCVYGGGWKKMESAGLVADKFEAYLRSMINAQTVQVVEYYGMIEQAGSIFFKCEFGRFHGSSVSRVLVRDHQLNVVTERPGIIQMLSIIPSGYPGHNLLTGDLGYMFSNRCECGAADPGFHLAGRLAKLEIRGCSDASVGKLHA